MSDELRVWLSKELEQRKWSHSELARQAGLSQAMISRTLAGERKASADFCIKVAKALGVTPEKLLRLASILPVLHASEDDLILAEIQDIAKNLSPAQRKEVLRYVRFLYQGRQEKDD